MNFLYKKKASSYISYGIIIGLISIFALFSLETLGNKSNNVFKEALNVFSESMNFSSLPVENSPSLGDTRNVSVLNGDGVEIWNGSDWNLTSVTCDFNYHEENLSCISNTRVVSVLNGEGTETWITSEWELTSVMCNSEYHDENLSCVSNVKIVSISNGSQIQTWNGSSWDISSVTCNSGYTQSGNSCISSSGTWALIGSGYSGSQVGTPPSGSCSPIGSRVYFEMPMSGGSPPQQYECR